jgi:hypothetical protein
MSEKKGPFDAAIELIDAIPCRCGSNKLFLQHRWPYGPVVRTHWRVVCLACGEEGPASGNSAKDAITVWNEWNGKKP